MGSSAVASSIKKYNYVIVSSVGTDMHEADATIYSKHVDVPEFVQAGWCGAGTLLRLSIVIILLVMGFLGRPWWIPEYIAQIIVVGELGVSLTSL